jgi:hypothetical protein
MGGNIVQGVSSETDLLSNNQMLSSSLCSGQLVNSRGTLGSKGRSRLKSLVFLFRHLSGRENTL